MKNLFFSLLFLMAFSFFTLSCTHTIDIRSSHFLTPKTGDEQWSGSVSFSGSQPTKITLVDDISANPPVQDPININKNLSVSDIFIFTSMDLNFNISVYPSLELLINTSTYGLKWQFLNHGSSSDAWVASIMGAMGSSTSSQTSNADRSESTLNTSRYGVSVGHTFNYVLPYVSYINEQHKTTTQVNNSHGRFGDYKNTGRHEYLTVGLSTAKTGFKAALEYNMINILWDDVKGYQNTVGLLLGFEW